MTTILWVVLLGIVVMYYFTRERAVQGIRNVDANTFAKELMVNNNKIVIDVRTDQEYKSGHLPNAVHIPISELEQRIAEIPKNSTVFIYCQSGMRSRRAGSILRKHGFSDIINLRGGILSWKGLLEQ